VTDLELPVSGLPVATDTSLDGGGMCQAVSVSPVGEKFLRVQEGHRLTPSAEGVVIVSFFDGIGGLREAWKLLGLEVLGFVSVEKDPA